MKKILLAAMALAAMFIIGCGGAAVIEAPEITSVIMNETSVTVTWAADTAIENDADFDGYNVYAYTDSSALLVTDGENLNKANTAVITSNTATITDLSQDSIYYIQVRTVNVDDKVGGYNATVPFIKASPRPEFVKTVYMEWVNGDTSDCAIHFSTGDVKKRADIDSIWGDMWIDHAVYAGPVDSVWFQSAYKADTLAGYRDTKLDNLGEFGFDEVWEATTPTLRTEPIAQGDLVIAKTVEGNYAKIHVDSLYFGTNSGWAKITYAYQNIVDFPYFSGRR